MPLDPFQARIARTALALPQAHTLALAGGGAMIAHGFVNRATKDIDLFTEVDDREAVEVAAALREALHEQGFNTRDAERPPPIIASSRSIRSAARSAPSKSFRTAADSSPP
jgi:hypothetical protein